MTRPAASGRWMAIVLLCLAATGRLDAQEVDPVALGSAAVRRTDTVMVGWQVDDAAERPAGMAGSFDWVRTTAGGMVFTAGGASFGSGPARWSLGRVGSLVRPHERTSVLASATLGAGEVAGDPFRYGSVRGDVLVAVHPRLTLAAGDEYLWGAGTRGHLVRAGSIVRMGATAALDVRYATSAAGSLDTRFVVGRLDVPARRLTAFGGGAVGRTVPEVLDPVLAFGAPVQQLRQAFVGVNVPVARTRITIVFDRLALPSAQRYTLTASVGVPVR